eukprot:m.227188 g.227188  ORF g.227188 m.227188 type:complete len:69 (-) comp95796_c0_seq1:222-428(-)
MGGSGERRVVEEVGKRRKKWGEEEEESSDSSDNNTTLPIATASNTELSFPRRPPSSSPNTTLTEFDTL